MTSLLLTVTRRKYIHVGSTPASMLAKVTASNTKAMSLDIDDIQQ